MTCHQGSVRKWLGFTAPSPGDQNSMVVHISTESMRSLEKTDFGGDEDVMVGVLWKNDTGVVIREDGSVCTRE